ncbi:MAG: hypothetical protein HPY71_14700 [Firmicutes bacterium]|nr:hypothetical protein [Bacillota bacterium]
MNEPQRPWRIRRPIGKHTALLHGFDRVEGALIANAEEQKILAQIFAWRKAGWTLREIADELNRQGIPTKQGGRWYASTVRYLL